MDNRDSPAQTAGLMRTLVSAAVAAALLTAAPQPAGANPVQRCPYPEAGRVVTAGDTTVSLCASAHPCPGWIGIRVTLNGEVLYDPCGPAHIDEVWTPMVCEMLVLLAPPGIPGLVDIAPDGDLAVDGYPVWECPPYDYSP